MDGNDACITADVTELIIMRTREDLATETAHESYTCMGIVRSMVFGAWRGCDGIVGGVYLREVVR